jgi:preprotein translocase subunit SecG
MSQESKALEQATNTVSESSNQLEGLIGSFLQSHPEIAQSLSNFGSRDDILTIVMVALGISFVIMLLALVTMKPRKRGGFAQPVANQELLFSKYAWEVAGESVEEAA